MRTIIVGCGRVGAGLASQLAEEGHEVVILDINFALTNGDNRNILAAQLAAQTFGIENVLCKINDPVRAKAYTTLGVNTINRTDMMIDSIDRFMGKPGVPGATDVTMAVAPPVPATPAVPAISPPAPTVAPASAPVDDGIGG